ncbi:MAG: hypothetical protein AB9917_15340 [Negativicutes bacterium]
MEHLKLERVCNAPLFLSGPAGGAGCGSDRKFPEEAGEWCYELEENKAQKACKELRIEFYQTVRVPEQT